MPNSSDDGAPPTADLAKLECVARANGYWHHIVPFAEEITRLQSRVKELEDNAYAAHDAHQEIAERWG